MLDYYTILEVAATATKAEIKRSYRRLVRKYHPDLHQETLDKQIKLLNEAYAVLSDVAKRAAYDAVRAEEKRRVAVAREALRRKQMEEQVQVKREVKMTWIEGVFGFMRELRKGLREE